MKFSGTTLLTSLVVLTGGCAEQKFVGRSGLEVVQSRELPPPNRADLTFGTSEYVIGPSDKLTIDVLGVPEASAKSVTVDPTGRLSVPIAGNFHAAGMTPDQLTAAITQRLRENYVRDPRVSVNVDEIVSQLVTVDGSVGQPGSYPIGSHMTLERAIARAQGLSEVARDNYVVVFRTIDGKNYAALYDLRAIRAGMYPDPAIYANDVIYVDESRARRVFRDVIAGGGIIIAPLITLLK